LKIVMRNAMRWARCWTLALALSPGLGSAVVSAQAEEEPAPTGPASEEKKSEEGKRDTAGPESGPGERRRDLKWSIGAGFVASPRPYVGAHARVFPIPVLGLEYKRWFLQGIRGGYHFIQTDRLKANVFAQVRFQGLEPDQSSFLEGMEERRKSMDGGVELVFGGRPVGFRVAALTDALGRSKGQEVSLLAVGGVPLGGWGVVLVGFGPRWLSQNRVDYYYGVRESEATAIRPSYSGDSTWNWDLNVTTILNVTSRWGLLALLNREGLGSGITRSPLVDRTSTYSLVTAVNYNF